MPIQPFSEGVTTILAIRGENPVLVLVKLIFPAPLAPSPMAVFEFVQSNDAPLVPLNTTATAVPTQTL